MDRESQAYDAQHSLIAHHHGKEVADKANYGWAVTEDDHRLSIATKVYGPGVVLTTNVNLDTGNMVHSWEDY